MEQFPFYSAVYQAYYTLIESIPYLIPCSVMQRIPGPKVSQSVIWIEFWLNFRNNNSLSRAKFIITTFDNRVRNFDLPHIPLNNLIEGHY